MISPRPDTGEMLSRLEAAVALPGIPAGAAKRCRTLIDRLKRPVRLGLLGFPDAGQSLLLNALAGEAVIPEGLALPTFELTHGQSPRMQVTRSDGTIVEREGRPGPALLDDDPIFIRASLPLGALKGRSLLTVVAPDRQEMGPALDWAASRCDIALWCSRDWSTAERAIWAKAPDSLKNHAMLVLSRDAADSTTDRPGARPERVDGFERVFRITPLRLVRESQMTTVRPAAGLDALLGHVRQVIEDGRAEDLDAATMLLHRHERRRTPTRPAPSAPSVTPAPVADDRPAAPSSVTEVPVAEETPVLSTPDRPEDAAPVPAPPAAPTPPAAPVEVEAEVPAEAHAALSRAFQAIRQGATELLGDVPPGPVSEDAAEDLLSAIETVLGSVLAVFEDEDILGETWPDLGDAVLAAQEMALLLRVEGGAEQAEEAAALLLQVRREIEMELAG